MDDAQFDALYMTAQGNCPGCGTPLTFKDAGQLAMSHGLNEVVMCHNCGNVYKINLKPHVMEFPQFVQKVPLNYGGSTPNMGANNGYVRPSRGFSLDPLKEFFSTSDFNVKNVKTVKIITAILAVVAVFLLVTNGYFTFSLDGILWIIVDALSIIAAGAYLIPLLKNETPVDDKVKCLSVAFTAAFFYLEVNYLFLFGYTGLWDPIFYALWDFDIIIYEIIYIAIELLFSAVIGAIFYFVFDRFLIDKVNL